MTSSAADEALLALQDCDSAISQLQHRRANSPETAAVAETERAIGGLAESLRAIQVDFTTAAEAHAAVDAELGACEKRLGDLRLKLEHATGNSRDLMAMSDEVQHLSTLQSDLEDKVLGALDVLEPLQARVEDISSRGRALTATLGEQRSVLLAFVTTIDAELGARQDERGKLAAALPPAQLAQYDKMRKNMGGVAVARFDGAQCHGCDLNRHWGGAEVAELRATPADTLAHCVDCGRIVVES